MTRQREHNRLSVKLLAFPNAHPRQENILPKPLLRPLRCKPTHKEGLKNYFPKVVRVSQGAAEAKIQNPPAQLARAQERGT